MCKSVCRGLLTDATEKCLTYHPDIMSLNLMPQPSKAIFESKIGCVVWVGLGKSVVRYDWSRQSAGMNEIGQECLHEVVGLDMNVGVAGIGQDCLWQWWDWTSMPMGVGGIGQDHLWKWVGLVKTVCGNRWKNAYVGQLVHLNIIFSIRLIFV